MIKGKDIYDVLAAIVPLYVPMVLAYGSVQWWKIFTPDQCSGINRFVAVFAVPVLSFHFISSNDPYSMNFKFLAADSLQKVVILSSLFLWNTFTKHGSLDRTITLFSLSTLPNTIIVGVPLLNAMYGEFSASLVVQIVVLQSVIWYTLLLIMFEYRGAKNLISQQFPETAGSISSLRVDSNVSSFNGRESLQADAEIGEDGKLHVMVRSLGSSLHKSCSTPRGSNLTGVEIYSVHSSTEPVQRAFSFNQADFYANSLQSVGLEDEMLRMQKKRFWRSKSCTGESFNVCFVSSCKSLKSMFLGSINGGQRNGDINVGGDDAPNMGLHMFVWSSTASPASDVNLRHAVNTIASADLGTIDPSLVVDFPQETVAIKAVQSEDRKHEIEDKIKYSINECQKEDINEGNANKKQQMPAASVMTRLILTMAWRRLVRNPNTYAALLGFAWSLISFRWNIKLPSIIIGSITILSNTGLGMATFSLGLFTALQPKIIACGKTLAAISLAIKFLVGPAVIAATSTAIGIRGVLLHVAIVQAAIPLGIVPFVFAKEYNLHANILSTAVIFGMAVALPVTLLYYILLEL